MMRDNRGRVGDVARSLGGILVTPPVDPDYIRRYVGELKGFPKIDELITIVSGGGAGDRSPISSRLTPPSDHRREKCLVIKNRQRTRSPT